MDELQSRLDAAIVIRDNTLRMAIAPLVIAVLGLMMGMQAPQGDLDEAAPGFESLCCVCTIVGVPATLWFLIVALFAIMEVARVESLRQRIWNSRLERQDRDGGESLHD